MYLSELSVMAKAVYTTPTGGNVSIEGSPAEVAELMTLLGRGGTVPRKGGKRSVRKRGQSARHGVVQYVTTLRDEGFFRTPRKLAEVGEALRKDGHLVPPTAVAVSLLRLVRRKELQRTKESGVWKYGNR